MTRVVGFLHSGRSESFQRHFWVCARRMRELVEDNIEIRPKWADDNHLRLADYATELASMPDMELIVAAGGPQSSHAAMQATRAARRPPVVFMSTTDPIGLGLVEDLDRPGTNMTGIAGLTSELDVPRLELLRELLAGGQPATIGVLTNGGRIGVDDQYAKLAAAAPGMNFTLMRRNATDLAGIQAAFTDFKFHHVHAVIVTADSLFNDLRHEVVASAKGLRAIFQWREFAEAGGLMSFGPNIFDAYTLVGEYAARILNGRDVATFPVSLPDRLELVINLRVAEIQRFTIPTSLLSRAEFVRNSLGP